MRIFRHILAHLLWIIPLLAWLGVGAYVYQHHNAELAKGKCVYEYTSEHWHKHSPPTYSNHAVRLYNNKAYVVSGTCSDSYVSWEDEHKILTFIGICSILPYGILCSLILTFVGCALYDLFKLIYGKK